MPLHFWVAPARRALTAPGRAGGLAPLPHISLTTKGDTSMRRLLATLLISLALAATASAQLTDKKALTLPPK
jgi:hypothetical protein